MEVKALSYSTVNEGPHDTSNTRGERFMSTIEEKKRKENPKLK